MAILLSSLPESYDPLVTALEGRPEEDLKLDYIKGKLLDDWRRRSEGRIQEGALEKVMTSTVQAEGRRNVPQLCFYCKEAGHFRWNCPTSMKKREAREKKQKVYEETRVVQHPDAGSSNSRGVCFTTICDTSCGERWIIDSGCTRHMTSTTTSLGWWNPCTENVSFADGKTVIAKGSGQGRIVGRGLADEAVEINVKELRFVPGLSVNVVSVSRITDEGYSVHFGPMDCRNMKEGVVVAMGEKSGGLYYLRQ